MNNPPLRLPNVQARPSNKYYAPNPSGPQPLAPIQPPAPQDTQMATAMGNFAQQLLTFGSTLKKQEITNVEEAENLKVERMNVEEARAYSKTVAREAEKSGVIDFGTNFYRIEAAQRATARKMMREVYAPMLVEAEKRMTDPMNPANPQDYAKQVLQEAMENEGITGFYGQSEATALYQQMADPWIEQVRRKRGERMVALNEELLVGDAVSALHKYKDGDTSFADVLNEIESTTDDYYDLTGESGREHTLRGVQAHFTTQISIAVAEKDQESLDDLESLLVLIRDKGKESAYTGAFNFNDVQQQGLEEMDARLAIAQRKLDDQTDNERAGDNRDVSDAVSAYMLANPDNLSTAHTDKAYQDMMSHLDTEIGLGNITRNAVTSYMANEWKGTYTQFTDDGKSPKGLMDDMVTLVLNNPNRDAVKAIVTGSDLTGREKITVLNLIEQMQIQAVQDVSLAKNIHIDALDNVDLRADIVADAVNNAVGDDPAYSDTVAILPHMLRKHALELVTRTRKDTVGTDEDKRLAADAAVTLLVKNVEDVMSRTDVGVDFDITEARSLGLPDDMIRQMERVSQSVRDFQLSQNRVAGEFKAGINIDENDWADVAPFAMIDDISASPVVIYGEDDRVTHNKQITALREKSHYVFVYGRRVSRLFGSSLQKHPMKDGEALSRDGTDTVDVEATAHYEQAARLGGLTPAMMLGDHKNEWGWDTGTKGIYKDPRQTLMNNPDTWLKDLEEISSVNTSTMEEDELFETLNDDNDIVIHYKAYKSWVGENDAVSFNQFVQSQIKGIGHYTLPKAPKTLMDKLNGN
jgi:hypothetical protein